MIDNDTLERIALHVLDVPEPDSDARIEGELSAGYHSRYLGEMEDLAAEIALSVPERPPPVRALGRALVEVGSEMRGGGPEPQSRTRWPWTGVVCQPQA